MINKKPLLLFLALIFHFVPRDKHLWLTGKTSLWYEDFTPPNFFDNSKYFYLYLVNNTNEKVYWISSSSEEIKLLKSMNLPVVNFKSLKGVIFTLRAKYFFHHYGINQISNILQYGAIQLDFWHGTPLKKVRYDVVPKPTLDFTCFKSKIIAFLNKGSEEYVSSTSEYLSNKILCKAFDVKPDYMLNYGYPRTDIIKFSKDEIVEFAKRYSPELISYLEITQKYEKVLLYMPTWRDDDPDYFSKANIDFKTLNEKLRSLNYVFFLKLHPLTKSINLQEYTNIIQIANDVDIYPFLNFTDFLITDYSSIYFDYLLTDKEIIFIPYDYDNYVKNRELYFNYDDITPGIKYRTFDDFIINIDSIRKLDYSDARKKIKDKFITNYNFDACEKIYQKLRLRNEQ